MNMYDPPLMGIFEYNKKYTAYSLKVLVGLDVEEPAKMRVKVENFLTPNKNGRDMRMDARINLRGNTRADIEIQKFRNKDELSRALFYLGGLLVDYKKGLKKLPKTMSIVVFICNFYPFLGTPYEGMTRMRYTLRSEDGAKKWNNDKPKSIEEENVRIYLEDMQKKDPRDMKSCSK